MQSIQKSFTVPKHVNQQHKAAVPHEETDKMLLYSIMNLLQEQKKYEFLDYLSNLPRTKSFPGVQSEDMMREIRSGRAQEIMAHALA